MPVRSLKGRRHRRRVAATAAAVMAAVLVLSSVPAAPAVSLEEEGEEEGGVGGVGGGGHNRRRVLQHEVRPHDGDGNGYAPDPRFTVEEYYSANKQQRGRYRRAYWDRIHRINKRIRIRQRQRQKQRQKQRPPIEVYDEKQTFFDGFVLTVEPLCGANPDGRLSMGQGDGLERALVEYLDDEAKCDPRTDEKTEEVRILDFVGGGDCFGGEAAEDGTPLWASEANGRRLERKDWNRETHDVDVEWPPPVRLRGLQSTPDQPEQTGGPDGDGEQHATRERQKKRGRGGRGVVAGRRSAFRVGRKYTCRRCRKKAGTSGGAELAEDSFNNNPNKRNNRNRGTMGNGGRALADLPPQIEAEDKEGRGEEETFEADGDRELQQGDGEVEGCDANLVNSIRNNGFPEVVEARIAKWGELDCSVGSETCLDPNSGCCGAPDCTCPVWSHPTCPYASRNYGKEGAGATFEFEDRMRIEGLCGDREGGTAMSDAQRGKIESFLLDYARSVLDSEEGGCVADISGTKLGLEISFVEVTQLEPAWFCGRNGEAAKAAASAGGNGSVVTVSVRGQCGQFACLGRFPSGLPGDD